MVSQVTQVLPPTGVPFVDARGMLDFRWLRFLTALQSIAPPGGTGFVVDSTSSYATMSIGQGPQASLPGTAVDGAFFIALDTARIYYGNGGAWNVLSEAFTGDVTKAVGSQVLNLANVFFSPGTYGSSTAVPRLTVDAKGRITNLTLEPIVLPPGSIPGGPNSSLQFNDGGAFAGTQVFYDSANQSLFFVNPDPTFQNLSPLTTKGDILVRNSSSSVRLPVGQNGTVLKASSSAANGVFWASPGTWDIPFEFNVVSSFPLLVVPSNLVVKSVTIYLEAAYNSSSSTLSVGDAVNNNALLATSLVFPDEAAAYESTPCLRYLADTQVNLYNNPAGSTSGRGIVTLVIQE